MSALRALAAVGFCFLCAYAHASEPPRFDARATLKRAQVGTYSPRAALPVRVELKSAPTRRPPGARFAERLICRPNPVLPETIICEHPEK